MNVEWRNRVAFAEIAEAIGCSTRDIVGAMPRDGGYFILFTTNTDLLEDATLWSVECVRAPGGILISGQPQEIPEGMQELKNRLDEAFNDPEDE